MIFILSQLKFVWD